MKKAILIAMVGVMTLSSCYSTGQGAYTGAYFGSIMGSAMGGIIGGRSGRDVGTLVGMATGTAIGATAGSMAEDARYEKMQKRRERMERKRQREEARRRSFHHQDEMYTYSRSRSGFTLERGKVPDYVAPNGSRSNSVSDRDSTAGYTSEPTYDDRIEIK